MRWYKAIGLSLIPSVLIVAGVGGFLLSGKTQMRQRTAPQSEIEQPDMRVQNLHLIEQAETGDTWELLAREAEFYDAKQKVIVYQLRAHLLAQEASPVHVIADYGQIDSTTGDMTVQG